MNVRSVCNANVSKWFCNVFGFPIQMPRKIPNTIFASVWKHLAFGVAVKSYSFFMDMDTYLH